MSKDLELKFDPRTIKHLGVKMYATLPPATAELISNSYDADASAVEIALKESGGSPVSITVKDNGDGMSYEEIQSKFLVIGRNRRVDVGDKPSAKFHRLATGKKGLGKLALFGLAKKIQITTTKNGLSTQLTLDWDKLLNTSGNYSPAVSYADEATKFPAGTTIKLTDLKRTSAFDPNGLANSLSKIFITSTDFEMTVVGPDGKKYQIDNDRRYEQFDEEFAWDVEPLVPVNSLFAHELSGHLYTSEKPIPPKSGLRGITLFSRGKLVNAPEYFSESTSSHFYQYLTGIIEADFIDTLPEDVISTNRQSIDWETDEMLELRKFLTEMEKKVSNEWRVKRAEKKEEQIKKKTGVDKNEWLSTLPSEIRKSTEKILNTLEKEESLEHFAPIIEQLHFLIPEYPLLHWRHLHLKLRDRVKTYYKNEQYGEAADQGAKIYCEELRKRTGLKVDGYDIVNRAFSDSKPPWIKISTDDGESGKNMQEGQGHLSRGLIAGFRNPISHAPIDTLVPKEFSELDCLNVLSLTSYLMSRLEKSTLIK